MALNLYDLEKAFIYRDFILPYVNKRFPYEKYFREINIKDYYSLSIDDATKRLYKEQRLYWIIFFFNPDLDMDKFFIRRNVDEHSFIKNKLQSVYENTLDMNYGVEEIEKVFNSYHDIEEDLNIIIPLEDEVYNIESYIIDLGKNLENGE